MPIRMPLDADIREGQPKLFSLAHPQGNALIDDRAVALGSTKGITQKLAGTHDVVEQPDLAKIIVARQMKSEKTILQRVRDELKKFDLTLRREPNIIIFDLPTGHPGLLHQRRHVDTRLS